MCDHYSTSNVQASVDLAFAAQNLAGNLPPQPNIFPVHEAPTVRTGADGAREIAVARWGMPSSQLALMEAARSARRSSKAKDEPVEFKEPLHLEEDFWFAYSETRRLAFFERTWTAGWTCVRKLKTGVETVDLYGSLAKEPSEPVACIHPKAMPVILTEPEEIESWMRAPWEEAKALQRPLPAGAI